MYILIVFSVFSAYLFFSDTSLTLKPEAEKIVTNECKREENRPFETMYRIASKF